MSTFVWFPMTNLTDTENIQKAAQVMQGVADLLAMDNADDVVEIPKSTASIMVDVLNSMAELVIDIALALNKKQGGNVQRFTRQGEVDNRGS